MNKIVLYIRMLFLSAFGSKMRCFLFIVGSSLEIFIFATGNLLLDSYYDSKFEEIRHMPDEVCYTSVETLSSEERKELFFEGNYQPTQEKISGGSYTIYDMENKNDQTVIINARLHGLGQATSYVIDQSDGYGSNLLQMSFKQGEMFSETDIRENKPVCIIDTFTAELLFGKNSAIGQKIWFGKYNDGTMDEEEIEEVGVTVVGVCKDSYYTQKKRIEYRKTCEDIQRPEIYQTINLYWKI